MSEITLKIKLTPKASRNEITGWAQDGNGDKILKVSVTAAPEKGKANKALIELLAKKVKVPKSNVRIISGETSRLKTVTLDGATFNELFL